MYIFMMMQLRALTLNLLVVRKRGRINGKGYGLVGQRVRRDADAVEDGKEIETQLFPKWTCSSCSGIP